MSSGGAAVVPTSPRVNVQDSQPSFAFLGMPGDMGFPVGSCELLSGPGAAILLLPKPADPRCPSVVQHRALHSSGAAGVGSCASFTISWPPTFLMLGREDYEGQDVCHLSTASSHEPFEIVAHELGTVHGLGQSLLV